jgi:uncharacterized protein YxeA
MTQFLMENERKIEILAIILFGVLLLLVVLVLANSALQTQRTIVYNNYYTENTTNNYGTSSSGKVVYNPRTFVVYKDKENYNDREIIFENDEDELDYSSYSRHFREKDELGSYVEEFDVYVRNEDSVGGYFQVVFYFENCYGEEFAESITEYIKPRETEKFKYMDIWYKEKEICNWDYKIFS